MTSILGISAFYHDSAAALIIDGKIISAAQEERFSRKKHDASYPYNAVEFVLNYSHLKLSKIDHIVFFEKPFFLVTSKPTFSNVRLTCPAAVYVEKLPPDLVFNATI